MNRNTQDSNSLECIRLTTDAGASTEIFLHGAHVSSWRPASDQQERLFVSGQTYYKPGVAIRGGVPVIFPQFAGRGPLRKHGFARTSQWQLLSSAQLDAHTAQAVLALSSSDETRELWPHNFAASYTVTLRDNQLDLQLKVTNTGNDSFSFTGALHSYFLIGDIHQTQLQGLQGSHYEAADNSLQPEAQTPLQFGQAIDRIYHKTASPLTLLSPSQRTNIQAHGFEDTVVWNPWAEGCAAMDDMADTDYQKMLCIEAAAAIDPIILHSNESWTGGQTLLNNESNNGG